MHHDLKIAPAYFKAVVEGRKTFEIRKDDRGFQAGDTVTLMEYDDGSLGHYVPPSDRFTGAKHDATIGYVTAFQQQPGYMVFSLLSNTTTTPLGSVERPVGAYSAEQMHVIEKAMLIAAWKAWEEPTTAGELRSAAVTLFGEEAVSFVVGKLRPNTADEPRRKASDSI